MGEDSTWKEMERAVKKDGFREGAAKGSESSFQLGFDDGFLEGMKFGKALGQLQGSKIGKNEKHPLPDSERGNCYICSEMPKTKAKSALPESIYSKTYEEVKELQRLRNESSLGSII